MSVRRGVLALVCVVALMGCGDDDPEASEETARSTTTAPAATTSTGPAPAPPPPGAIELSSEVPTRIPAGPHTWRFQVTNGSDAALTLTFPTAQRGDAVIEDDAGASVHRWSEDRFFTQQVHEVPLAPGQSETIELEDDLTGVEPGYYRVVLSPALVGEVEPFDRSIRIVEPGT